MSPSSPVVTDVGRGTIGSHADSSRLKVKKFQSFAYDQGGVKAKLPANYYDQKSTTDRSSRGSNGGGKMGRWFGILHVFVIEGESVAHSWTQYRRGRKFEHSRYCGRKMLANEGLCSTLIVGSPDMCFGKADPYTTIDLEIGGGKSYRVGRTHTVDNDHNPKWSKEFSALIDLDPATPCSMDFQASANGPNLILRVIDDDLGGESYSDILGQVYFPLEKIVGQSQRPMRVSLSIRHPKCKANSVTQSRIKVEFRWYSFLNPIAALPSITKTGGSTQSNYYASAQPSSVPHTYFRRSHGNIVRLYHDAACLPDTFPDIPTINGGIFSARSLWSDIYDAVDKAKYFVFVAGWSVNPAISLNRHFDDNSGGEPHETIGELFIRKANAGVSVCVLIWDDITSREGVKWLKNGLMATYDEYTREFFKNTKVQVAVVKRIAGDDVGQISELIKWTTFTHHQKIVVADMENPRDPGDRRIVGAFVGGLDLTSGRFDTADHSLFGTLKNAHLGDFYNGCLVDSTPELGPRQPWHDVHGLILGPGAWDILQTFIERVAKQAPRLISGTSVIAAELRDAKKLRDGRKVLIPRDDPNSWDVQVFRSLDTEAALFEDVRWISRFGNSTHFVEKSIQQAYCYLIDRAKSFIYIENQYFMGSSQYWLSSQDIACHNLVPYEIARRICRAIGDREDFTAYILIPLFPEGAPGSVSVQEILHWQYQTIRMMYHRIGVKLREANIKNRHPTDYLNFFFVAKREPDVNTLNLPTMGSTEKKSSRSLHLGGSGSIASPTSPHPKMDIAKNNGTQNSTQDVLLALCTRRHPIYVHSKMLLIDDDYILLGSANINERSMSGGRDTEIAFGACQPAALTKIHTHMNARVVQYSHGDIHAFRLQLWCEHLGGIFPFFDEPHTNHCVKSVLALAQQNWLAYTSPVNNPLPHGHLCPYPLKVEQDGTVSNLPDHINIPGFTSPIFGQRSSLLPNALTT